MNRKNLLIISLILFCLPITAFKSNNNKDKKVVVIDAGHGGKDSGAVGLISVEKDIVLAIALKVGNYIKNNLPNVEVIYTRTTDVLPALHERANIANKNNADLFVSIHANSNSNKKAYGTDSFVMGSHKNKSNLEVAKKENSVIVYEEDYEAKYEGFDPNSTESYIMFNLMQFAYLEQSLALASNVQFEFREKAKRKDRGVKRAGFLVLWRTTMPSVLIETGFISNPEEEKYLNSPDGQTYLASAIYRAIKRYFSDLEDFENEMEESSDSSVVNNLIEEEKKTKQKNEASNNDVFFRVQIFSASKKIDKNTGIYKKYTDIYEYQENKLYKYTVGNYKHLIDAKELQNAVKSEYPDAFIVAFRNGKKIPLKQALNN